MVMAALDAAIQGQRRSPLMWMAGSGGHDSSQDRNSDDRSRRDLVRGRCRFGIAHTKQSNENDGGAVAPATPPQEQNGRVQKLIRDKQSADAFAASSAAQAAALRERFQNAGRPQDYRAPEDYTRAVAEQAVREVGAEILNRQASQAQEIAARAAQDAWEESTAEFRIKCRTSMPSRTTRASR